MAGATDPFAPLDQRIDGLLDGIEPGSRRKLGMAIATDLRAANARRIKANVTPEGAAMAPRKTKPSGNARTRRLRDAATRQKKSVKMGRMFQRAAGPSILRREASEDEARVGYPGALARVMAVHHFGLRNTVTRDPGSPEVTYATRPVIGLNEADRTRIFDKVVASLDA